MVDRQALHERSRLGHDVVVVPRLRTEQSGLQRPGIADARRAAVALCQHGMHAEHVGHGQVVARHGLLGKLAVKAVEFLEA